MRRLAMLAFTPIVSVIAGCSTHPAPVLERASEPGTEQVHQATAAGNAPKFVVEGHPARPWSYEGDGPTVRGSITWYSAADLDRIVREYVREKKLDFAFNGTEAQFWVARDRTYMARAVYSSGMGKPILDLEIGFDGYVKKHSVGIGVCGNTADASDRSRSSVPSTGPSANADRKSLSLDEATALARQSLPSRDHEFDLVRRAGDSWRFVAHPRGSENVIDGGTTVVVNPDRSVQVLRR